MINITDWINYELYPTLFESIDIALPEHNFKRYSGGWRSKTYLYGSPHNREDKTVVSKKAPGRILENGGENLSLVDYVIKRDRVEFIQAVKSLADVVGLQLPKGEFNQENYQRYKDQATLLEECNNYFIFCLENSTGADEVRAYLSSRGYLDEDVKAMELGYIPDQAKLFKYLLSKGYSQSLIDEVVKLNKGIGSTHKLTIPYRSGGSIKGFKFRALVDKPKLDTEQKTGGYRVMLPQPKYLNSTGLDRLGGFFNLSGIKGDKDVVIVEGELDSLSATARGVENVVATGGSSISSEQIKDAIKRGAKSFTLCLDTEPGKEEETVKRLNSAIEVILGERVNRVYIVTLPDLGGSKTDPDRLIKESGVDAFRTAIAQAIPHYKYSLIYIFNKYAKLQEDTGELTDRQLDSLLTEIVETASKLQPIDKNLFISLFLEQEPIKNLGITQEALNITIDKITATKEKEQQKTEFNNLIKEVNKLQESGEINEALDLLDTRVKEVKLKDKVTEFNSLLQPVNETDLREHLTIKPESIKSGYTIGGEELLLPSGAISVFCAPTSHGKTSMLINLALNTSEQNKEKQVYLFSYEEDRESILIKTLNTYLDTPISGNNRTTLENYFSGKNRVTLPAQKDTFFKELIETNRLNIVYSNYNSDTLIEAIRYLKKTTNVGAVFIDYIQLLNLPQGKYKTYSRQEELKNICISLKDIAVETGLPIIIGAQFNREVTTLQKIHATKIGEAGDIERIASLIVGFWNNNFKPIGTQGEVEECYKKLDYLNNGIKGESLYSIVLKNRGGKVGGEELLSFNGNTGKIKNSIKEELPKY
jgi:DNA primase